MTPPAGMNPLQLRTLKCGHCRCTLFEQLNAGPVLQDRLDPSKLHFTPVLAFRCAGCLRLFDPAKAAPDLQEIAKP